MARNSPPPDWISGLDFDRALRNCHVDFLGDWYRDPWGWPEVDWAVKEAFDEVVAPRVRALGVKHVAKLDVAKENFSVRPAVVMDPIDRLCYQALTDALSKTLIGNLSPFAYGWRLARRKTVKGDYGDNAAEWESYRRHLEMLGLLFKAGLKTDIVSFFASVPIPRLSEDILDHANNSIARRLVDMLAGFDAVNGRSGLPQRSFASAALAHFYLWPLDQVLLKHSKSRRSFQGLARRGRSLRWMDDVWVFGSSAAALRGAQVDIQRTLEDLGLRMNIAKTDVLEGDDLDDHVYSLEHSAVDGGLASEPPDLNPLDELIDTVLSKPEHADRTSVRFATIRMRKHSAYERVGEFEDNAKRMPHASDALARLFRDAGEWTNLQEWYVKYAQSSWACIDWSTAQLGTMFPSSKAPEGIVVDHMASRVDDTSLAMVGLAAQRLAAWNRDVARDAVRDAGKSVANPAARRALALAALSAGEERAVIRKMLGEFEESQVTLRMLESRNFKRPRVSADFVGG